MPFLGKILEKERIILTAAFKWLFSCFRKKLKLSGKRWNHVTNTKSNTLLDELFGQLSMESDGSGSKFDFPLDTERSTSLPTRSTNANPSQHLSSSLEAQNGSRQNSYSTNAYVYILSLSQ